MIREKTAYAILLILAIISVGAAWLGYVGPDLLAFFLFVIILAALIYKDRKKVRLEGIMFIRRTQKGRDFIDRTAQRHKKFWGKFATLGLIVGVPVMIIGSIYLASQAAVVVAGGAEGGVRLLLPGPVNQPVNVPGIFVVPWWIWIIGIAAVIIPHEFMHGVVCRLDKIKIKSVGWILLVVIPGAFVEPDEKELQRAKKSTRMKVYAAGSFANLVVALAIAMIFIASFPLLFQPVGLFVASAKDGPAIAAGLEQGTITELAGMRIRSQEDLTLAISRLRPGEDATVRVLTGNTPSFGGWEVFTPQRIAVAGGAQQEYTLKLAEHPELAGRAYMGVQPLASSYTFAGDIGTYNTAALVLFWIFIFSFGIGLVNMLPIKPLDGGLLFEELVGHFTPRTKNIVRVVSIVMIALILFNLLGPVFLGV